MEPAPRGFSQEGISGSDPEHGASLCPVSGKPFLTLLEGSAISLEGAPGSFLRQKPCLKLSWAEALPEPGQESTLGKGTEGRGSPSAGHWSPHLPPGHPSAWCSTFMISDIFSTLFGRPSQAHFAVENTYPAEWERVETCGECAL